MGPEGDWQSPWVIAPLVYSGLSVLGFCSWARYTERPLIPQSVYEDCGLMVVRSPFGCFGTFTFMTKITD